jgi:hypothetical protein
VVVDAGLGSQPGLDAYPWSPEGDATVALRPFDYGDFDIVAPR